MATLAVVALLLSALTNLALAATVLRLTRQPSPESATEPRAARKDTGNDPEPLLRYPPEQLP